MQCLPGFTYVLYSEANTGKTTAVLHAVDHIVSEVPTCTHCLYVNGKGEIGVPKKIMELMNAKETVTRGDLADSLVAAFPRGSKGVLFVDEVNLVDPGSDDENANFVSTLFQSVLAHEALVCIIVTNKKVSADTLLNLNRGKIWPFPPLHNGIWN